MVADVHDDQSTDPARRESFARHPLHATVKEVAHLRKIANEGESAETPAILAGAALAFVATLATLVFLLVFGIAHLA
jgi:cobalamin biosynthesis protein CobD/CbiB